VKKAWVTDSKSEERKKGHQQVTDIPRGTIMWTGGNHQPRSQVKCHGNRESPRQEDLLGPSTDTAHLSLWNFIPSAEGKEPQVSRRV
jgi:hypothetical protein